MQLVAMACLSASTCCSFAWLCSVVMGVQALKQVAAATCGVTLLSLRNNNKRAGYRGARADMWSRVSKRWHGLLCAQQHRSNEVSAAPVLAVMHHQRGLRVAVEGSMLAIAIVARCGGRH